jgi:hypothetical protein
VTHVIGSLSRTSTHDHKRTSEASQPRTRQPGRATHWPGGGPVKNPTLMSQSSAARTNRRPTSVAHVNGSRSRTSTHDHKRTLEASHSQQLPASASGSETARRLTSNDVALWDEYGLPVAVSHTPRVPTAAGLAGGGVAAGVGAAVGTVSRAAARRSVLRRSRHRHIPLWTPGGFPSGNVLSCRDGRR